MYHPDLIAARFDTILQDHVRQHPDAFPGGIPDPSIDDSRALTAQILAAYDPETERYTRPLLLDEQIFITYAQLRVMADAIWYLQVFVYIDEEGHGLRPLYPLWPSQQFVLDRLAALELRKSQSGDQDGLLLNILKVRQVGISTLGMALTSHRIVTQPYIRAIAGSDTEEQARYLFRMVERIYDQLPPFLRPARVTPYAAGRELNFSNSSSIKTAWGKTTRGALQDVGGKKGNIERGRTNSVVHISELATWDNPEQLDSSLLPGIPRNPKTLVLFESTAELAGDWWHRHWQATSTTTSRFANLFIPWCVKYELPAPASWTPTDETLKVAASIERDSFAWVGETLRPTRDQLYWYETERAYFAEKKQVHQFFKEYPSNPEECFQYAGRSIFTLDEIAAIDHAARKIVDIWACEPAREIAELRRLPDDEEADDDPRVHALHADRRPPAPLSVRVSPKTVEEHPVPPGYGFRRLAPTELEALPSVRHSVFTIYEYPRPRGRRRYILGVDVGDGLGQDYSVITVVRGPTLEEPAEDVAQYISNSCKPSTLAYITDAIGRYYSDEDGIEACAAIELNNHGMSVQDLLQLHLGYTNFYLWEYVDAADPQARYSRRIGWTTTTRTRPMLLEKFHDGVTTVDPLSGLADFRVNSPITRSELRFFVTEGTLGEAQHANGQHDDCIFSSAIAYFVAWRLSGGESEPIAEKRRRRALLLDAAARTHTPKPDWRNSAVLAAAATQGQDDEDDGITDPDSDFTFFSGGGRNQA